MTTVDPTTEWRNPPADAAESHGPNRSKLGHEPPAAATAVRVIKPASRWQLINLGELWQYRELLYFLAWRDFKVRYKQTLLGIAWAVIQPVMMMVVFTVFFGRIAKLPSGELPYPIFVYAGLLPWTFFAGSVTRAGNSMIQSERIVTKVYFPRLAVPIASTGAAMVDFTIAFSILIALMIYYGIAPGIGLLLVPALLLLMTLAALGVGTFLAALNVAYRDFRYVIPFLVQLWMFATPGVYMQVDSAADAKPRASRSADAAQAPQKAEKNPSETPGAGRTKGVRLPGRLKKLLAVNPMTGVIGSFRAATLNQPIPWADLGVSAAVITVLLLAGFFYFRSVEDGFADII